MVSSSVFCSQDIERIGSSTCLQCSRKTFALCSKRCCVRGLVRSPVTATLPQISSRLFLVWGILWSFPEIIRYSFFGFKETFGFTPSWLLWLRYSSFLVLYPTGISSEVGLIYIALPFIKASGKYCIRMPNKWNSSFDYFYAAIVAMGIYVPGMSKTSFSLLTMMSLG
ncbi:Very-long-chain (3R)-3-hydroxyacyl-CoA dehydratase PASTICCINO 2A [Glycine soja]